MASSTPGRRLILSYGPSPGSTVEAPEDSPQLSMSGEKTQV